MDSKPIILKTIFGSLELRVRRSATDVSKYDFAFCGDVVERALRAEMKYGDMPGLYRLARKEGFVRLAVGTTADDIVLGLMNALKYGWVVAASPGGGGGQHDAEDTAAWSAYYALQARFGKEFHLSTRKHRIVGQEQVPEIRQTADYDVVPAAEATEVINRLAKTAGVGPWQAAAATIAKHLVDLRSPPKSTGFMLLRAPMSYAERITPPEDVITPAKLKEWASKQGKAWIELRLVHPSGKPVPSCQVSLTDAEGASLSGSLDGKGAIRFEEVSRKGPAQVRFVKVPDRKGQFIEGTKIAPDESPRMNARGEPVVVSKDTDQWATVENINTYCLYQPVMTVAFAMPSKPEDLEHPIYVLRSNDGTYEKKKTPKDDLIAGDNLLELEFEELKPGPLYTMSRIDAAGESVEMFKDHTFMQIVDQPRAPDFDRPDETSNPVELAALGYEVNWAHDEESGGVS